MGETMQRYPLLRILFCYICGIGAADILDSHFGVARSLCMASLLCVAMLLVLRRKEMFGVVALGAFFALGICSYSLAWSKTEYGWAAEKRVYEARVLTLPRERQHSVMCEVEVTAMCDSSGWRGMEQRVLAYMAPCDEAEVLLPGDIICFRGKVKAPSNVNDSLEFDYARYVAMQGASGTVYLPSEEWYRVGEATLTLRERMLRFRQRMLREHMEQAFGGDALGVLAALTLGDKRGLSAEVRTAYADAGASHVLALSGMHVGVIYALLAFTLRALVRRRSLRWLRELLIITALWGFALLVGMSASVVRAVAMCTLYGMARWVSDSSTSALHTLSLTALLMLLVRPLYLFDVGFQLSFMAMAVILWLVPHFELLIFRYAKHPIAAYFMGIVGMSIAAQLGTFPLVLYHFGSFPVYFLLTNLLVIPALFVILMLMLVWWLFVLASIPFAQSLSVLLQLGVEGLNGCLWFIGQWPGATLHVQGYNACAVLFTYLAIFFVCLTVTKRWARGSVFALASLLGLLLILLFSN